MDSCTCEKLNRFKKKKKSEALYRAMTLSSLGLGGVGLVWAGLATGTNIDQREFLARATVYFQSETVCRSVLCFVAGGVIDAIGA